MIINGVEIANPDVSDVAFLEKYEAAHDRVSEKAKEISDNKSGMRRSQAVRKQCEAVFEFFDEVFGDGTAKKVFGEIVNLMTCISAYEEVVREVNRLDIAAGQKIQNLSAAYKPDRRPKKKKKRYNNYKPKLVAPKKS